MIYDFSLLTSFLFTSLFIFVSVYTIYHARNRVNFRENTKKSEEQVISKQITFDLNLLFSLLIILIMIRGFFLFIFPFELLNASLSDSIISIRFYFVLFQGIAVSYYIYYFFRLKLLQHISDREKTNQTLRLLYRGLAFSISELLVSFFAYAYLNYSLLLPEVSKQMFRNFDPLGSNFSVYLSIMTLVFFFLFLISYLILQKKKNLINIIVLVTLQVITIILALYLTIKQLPFFFTNKFLNESAMQLFSYTTGFIGWLWLGILLTGVGSQLYNLSVIRIRKKFANQQVAVNYSMQLIKICIWSLAVICTVSLYPLIFSILTFLQR